MKFFLLSLLFLPTVFSFDQRFFEAVFAGKYKAPYPYKWEVESPHYSFDWNSDGKLETLIASKHDGEDWIEIKNSDYQTVFKAKLPALGVGAKLTQAELYTLSPEVKVMVLPFYEGEIDYNQYVKQARFYFLSMEKNDLSTLKLVKGPVFLQENYLPSLPHYNWRQFNLKVKDFNQDGVRDISVTLGTTGFVYLYDHDGKWTVR